MLRPEKKHIFCALSFAETHDMVFTAEGGDYIW